MFEHTPKRKVIFSLEREKYHNLLKNYNFSGRDLRGSGGVEAS